MTNYVLVVKKHFVKINILNKKSQNRKTENNTHTLTYTYTLEHIPLYPGDMGPVLCKLQK